MDDGGGGGGGGESGAGHSPHVGDALADVLEVGALGDLLDDLVEALVREAPIAPCRAEVQDVDRDVLGEVVLGFPMGLVLGGVANLRLVLWHL